MFTRLNCSSRRALVALAFAFSMPACGAPPTGTGQQLGAQSTTPTSTAGGSGVAVAGAAATAGTAGKPASGGSAGSTVPNVVTGGAGASGTTQVGGAGASSGSMAGAGGNASSGGAGSAGSGVTNAGSGGASAPPASDEMFALMPVDFPMVMGKLAFPASAIAGMDRSPGFTWTGVPKDAKSLAFVFRDPGISATKWLVWDIAPTTTMIPSGVMPSNAKPPELPGASQLGSLMNQGYAGPVRTGLMYEFTLWALDVANLPVTPTMTTAEIFDSLLPAHKVAVTAPVVVTLLR